MKTILFYDLETTGLNKCFDQVLQFAAIRTDMALNEIERHEILVRLNKDVIPSPQAMITHRIDIEECQKKGVNEFVAMQRIHQLLNQPGTISAGYNTLKFDDEFLRFSFFRNLLPPYTHQYANQCSRLDFYPIAMMYHLFKNDIIAWPMQNDKVSLKLENINRTNNFVSGQSHNAMVDVEVTVALARKFFQANDMWHYALENFDKNKDFERINKLQNSFAIKDRYCKEALIITNGLVPVLHLGQHYHYKNQNLWLRLDNEALLTADLDNCHEKAWVLKRKPAEHLLLLPPNERYLQKIALEKIAIAQQNKHYLQKNPELFERICGHYLDYKFPKYEHIDCDAALYDLPFPTPYEDFLYQQFHLAAPNNKLSILEKFPNLCRRQQALRILARHFNEISLVDSPFNSDTVDYKGQQKITVQQALAEIIVLRNDNYLDEQQFFILDKLKAFLDSRAAH